MLIYIYLSSSCLNVLLKYLVVLNDFIFSGILYQVWRAAWITDLQIVLLCLFVICGAFLFLVLCEWMSPFKENIFCSSWGNSLWEYKYIHFPSCNLNSFATGNILRLLYMGFAGALYFELFIILIVLFCFISNLGICSLFEDPHNMRP